MCLHFALVLNDGCMRRSSIAAQNKRLSYYPATFVCLKKLFFPETMVTPKRNAKYIGELRKIMNVAISELVFPFQTWIKMSARSNKILIAY